MRSSSSTDVIVIGAGIVGAAVAHRLAFEGLDVLVIDAGASHPAATAAGMGHLVVMDEDAAEFALARASLATWDQWAPRLDAACAFQRSGTLWLAEGEADVNAAEAKLARLAAAGVAAEWLGAQALARAEPALRRGLAGGVRVPGDAIVYAPAAARWLLAHAARPVRVERAEVVAIGQGRVQLADGSRRHAAAVVLAAGMHAQRLCPELRLMPKRGQLVITERGPALVQHQLAELGYAASVATADAATVAFNLQPRPTGQLLIGSSREPGVAGRALNTPLLARMLRRATHFVPELAARSAIRAWTGVRAATPDGRPLIGAHPSRRGLWLALGHEGLGVTLAPGTAQLLAALMLGTERPSLDPAPFLPSRRMVPAHASA